MDDPEIRNLNTKMFELDVIEGFCDDLMQKETDKKEYLNSTIYQTMIQHYPELVEAIKEIINYHQTDELFIEDLESIKEIISEYKAAISQRIEYLRRLQVLGQG